MQVLKVDVLNSPMEGEKGKPLALLLHLYLCLHLRLYLVYREVALLLEEKVMRVTYHRQLTTMEVGIA